MDVLALLFFIGLYTIILYSNKLATTYIFCIKSTVWKSTKTTLPFVYCIDITKNVKLKNNVELYRNGWDLFMKEIKVIGNLFKVLLLNIYYNWIK